MAEESAIRRKRPSSSQIAQREALTSEQRDIARHLVVSGYFGRLICVALLLAVGLHGIADDRFKIAIMVSAFLIGIFWIIDNLRQRNRILRLEFVIRELDEETAPKSWEERSIRYEYHLKYSPEERVLGAIQHVEPLFWMFAVFAVSVFPKLAA
jgi:hypothetical protein